jgi:hypothetical protein
MRLAVAAVWIRRKPPFERLFGVIQGDRSHIKLGELIAKARRGWAPADRIPAARSTMEPSDVISCEGPRGRMSSAVSDPEALPELSCFAELLGRSADTGTFGWAGYPVGQGRGPASRRCGAAFARIR